MKRHAFLIAIFGVLLIGSGLISSFVESFARDVSDANESKILIEKEYNKFKDILQSFNSEREIIYNDIFNNLYIENIKDNYDNWFINLEEYEKAVYKVFQYDTFLNKYCQNIIYNDSNIQSKCDSMLISYETVNNYYVKDINKWNKFVDSYNSSIDDIIFAKEKYDLKGKNYIDYNDDGEYLGK